MRTERSNITQTDGGDGEKSRGVPPFFSSKDCFIYLFILLLVCALFLCFVILPEKKDAKGFIVSVEGKTVLVLEYDNPENYVITPYEGLVIKVAAENGTVTIESDDGKAINVISFDSLKRTVKMKESNCSSAAPCVHMPEIGDSGAIVCAPRKITISPFGDKFNPSQPSTGKIERGRVL